MNLPGSGRAVDSIKKAMNRFKDEVGSYMGHTKSNPILIGDGIEQQYYALRFENATIDLDLITNSHSAEELVKGFDLKENFA